MIVAFWKVLAEADAQDREALVLANEERTMAVSKQSEQLLELMQHNTQLTAITTKLSEHIEVLTIEIHSRFVNETS